MAVNARDRFCRLVIGGFIFTFGFNVMINLAMVIGLIPVVGMRLPFLVEEEPSTFNISDVWDNNLDVNT